MSHTTVWNGGGQILVNLKIATGHKDKTIEKLYKNIFDMHVFPNQLSNIVSMTIVIAW